MTGQDALHSGVRLTSTSGLPAAVQASYESRAELGSSHSPLRTLRRVDAWPRNCPPGPTRSSTSVSQRSSLTETPSCVLRQQAQDLDVDEGLFELKTVASASVPGPTRMSGQARQPSAVPMAFS